MEAVALPVDAKAVELIISAFAAAGRVNRALQMLEELPRKYELSPPPQNLPKVPLPGFRSETARESIFLIESQ